MTKITIPSAAELKKLSNMQLAACYNELLDLVPEGEKKPSPIKKFKTVDVGRNRIRNLAKLLSKKADTTEVKLASKKASNKKKPAVVVEEKKGPGRRRRGVNLQPPSVKDFTEGPTSCLIGSKQAKLVDMLSKAGGATMKELVDGMAFGRKPWTEQNIRSGFGWDMKLHGYGVRSEVVDGVERFFLVIPEGFSVVPHRDRKTASEE